MFEQLVLRACRFILYYSVFFCTIKSRPKLLLCWPKIQIRYICVTMIMTFSLVFLHTFLYFNSISILPLDGRMNCFSLCQTPESPVSNSVLAPQDEYRRVLMELAFQILCHSLTC